MADSNIIVEYFLRMTNFILSSSPRLLDLDSATFAAALFFCPFSHSDADAYLRCPPLYLYIDFLLVLEAL